MCTIFIMDCSLASCLVPAIASNKNGHCRHSFTLCFGGWRANMYLFLRSFQYRMSDDFEKKMPWRKPKALSASLLLPPSYLTAHHGGFTGQTNKNGLLDTAHWSTTTKEYSARRNIIVRERRRLLPADLTYNSLQ